MADVIQLLPDSVANQIAAGEVIQRPASIVKELTENAIDAGATHISIIIQDAGRTLVKVVDNGKGMSPSDARMSFERHATSKIKVATDLFALHTKGFRGEALASIAAVAQVTMKTLCEEDELATLIEINGSHLEKQEYVSGSKGTSIEVKNLFYNIPVRRKFLKSNSTEFRHILNEFYRIVLATPEIAFSLYHNNELVFDLDKGNRAHRIAGVFGRNSRSKLVEVNLETSIVSIKGYIGKPEFAKKKTGDQYFFINNRFMKHPYFHKAIVQAYGNLLPPDTVPSYFLYFEIDAAAIDINIHPTKTEVKFEHEQNIWPILMAGVKEGLGKFNVVDSIDFDKEGSVDIPVLGGVDEVQIPNVEIDPNYNPFNSTPAIPQVERVPSGVNVGGSWQSKPSQFSGKQPKLDGWESMYEFEKKDEVQTLEFKSNVGTEDKDAGQLVIPEKPDGIEKRFFQFKEQYIITTVKSGLMMIDQRRAHIRILYEQNLRTLTHKKGLGQKLLFPERFELRPDQAPIISAIKDQLSNLGFILEVSSEGVVEVLGIPDEFVQKDYLSALIELIDQCTENDLINELALHEKMAGVFAYKAAVKQNKILQEVEMESIVNKLFACEVPNYTPDGELVVSILQTQEIRNKFN